MNQEIDFTPPFKQLDMMDELQNEIRNKLDDEKFVLPNLNDDNAAEEFLNLHKLLNVKPEQPFTLNRLVDNLVGEFVEPKCIQPTFLINHPLIMSPLAKPHRLDPTKTERFELFVNGKEICNAYTELNNPIIQKEVAVEVIPKAISSAQDTLVRIESNMNRLDRFLALVLDKLENDMADEERDFDIREMDTAIKLHREVRETLGDLAKWIEKTADVDKQQSVSIIGVLQDVFSQKAPEEWREMRAALARAGVLE